MNVTLTVSIWYRTKTEYAETHGRSELIVTHCCLVNRQIKCYFSQPVLGKERMEELLFWWEEEDKESFLDGSEDIMDGLKEWVCARASPWVKPDGCWDYIKGKKHYCICVEKTTHAGSGSGCSGRNSFIRSFVHSSHMRERKKWTKKKKRNYIDNKNMTFWYQLQHL